ncbi:fungal specific transcription factor domain-containing protein [Colletotrichum tamarilloi]|uniref:Fungal specific transcription factor domain-containing protein n=1 Tax=Colletotrichum tamarilloi TaxID=1209934 RepID=A0ABQ9R9J9_9PEZI|nr:fungal specific transcription factor domain-containing protein [Colletotrichum tamarilloi]KAK1498303.1 fungal specific transcription factor domain-containing protein [Colletotrichum tamarilloi]
MEDPTMATVGSQQQGSHEVAARALGDRPLKRDPACVECRQRKLKCDRKYPCSECITHGRHCLAPPPSGPRKPRRKNHHELRDKLASIESLLEECMGSKPIYLANGTPVALTRQESPTDDQNHDYHRPKVQSPGWLVQTKNGIEFRDSKTASATREDEQTIRALFEVESEQSTWLPALAFLNQHHDSIGISPASGLSYNCVPSSPNIIILWRVFLDRVNPVTKILHIPTFQANIADAVSNFHAIPPVTQGLLFSLFLAASGSLSQKEHWDMLHWSKKDASTVLSRGFKTAMARYNYLKRFNEDTIRSLIFYSLHQRTLRDPVDPWILNGIVVNIAHRLGLHIDGTRLGFSPFQIEMRRRLWWQTVLIEAKTSAASCISAKVLPSSRDTLIPLNINDEDLHPSMKEAPSVREGPSEMSYCVHTYETEALAMAMQIPSVDEVLWRQASSNPAPASAHAAIPSPHPFDSPFVTAIQDALQKFDRTLGPLERRLLSDSAANPLHAMALYARTSLAAIVQIIITPLEAAPEWGTEIRGPEDKFFNVGLVALEILLEQRRLAGRQFAWLVDLDFKIQTFYYLGAQLQNRVSGSLAERTWAVIEKMYACREDLWELKDEENMTLANLLIVAWSRRAEHFLGNRVLLLEPPFVTRLRDEVMMIKAEALSLF